MRKCSCNKVQQLSLTVSGGRMRSFLQFKLGCHGLPIAGGRSAGAAHVGRAHRVCWYTVTMQQCAVGAEKHLMLTNV